MDLTDCKKGNHPLVDIYIDGYEDAPGYAVRWCEVCGSIVIDVDYDNRTFAGRGMKMRAPLITMEVMQK
jgi:hypothetical protein